MCFSKLRVTVHSSLVEGSPLNFLSIVTYAVICTLDTFLDNFAVKSTEDVSAPAEVQSHTKDKTSPIANIYVSLLCFFLDHDQRYERRERHFEY